MVLFIQNIDSVTYIVLSVPGSSCAGVTSEGVFDSGGQEDANDESGQGTQHIGSSPPVSLDISLITNMAITCIQIIIFLHNKEF